MPKKATSTKTVNTFLKRNYLAQPKIYGYSDYDLAKRRRERKKKHAKSRMCQYCIHMMGEKS